MVTFLVIFTESFLILADGEERWPDGLNLLGSEPDIN